MSHIIQDMAWEVFYSYHLNKYSFETFVSKLGALHMKSENCCRWLST